jgi:hypothetical protein
VIVPVLVLVLDIVISDFSKKLVCFVIGKNA